MSYSELRRRELQLQNSPLVISMCLFVQHIFSIKTSLYQNTHFCVLLIIHALRNIRDSVQTTFRTTSSETTGDTLSDAGHSLGSVRDPQALQALRRDVQQDRVLGRSPASCNEAYFSWVHVWGVLDMKKCAVLFVHTFIIFFKSISHFNRSHVFKAIVGDVCVFRAPLV